jgi:aspartate/methionine/tyrosine aminotransferase
VRTAACDQPVKGFIPKGLHFEGYLRLTYANSVENIERVLERMGAVLQRSS